MLGAIITGAIVGYIACRIMGVNAGLLVKILLGIAGGAVGGWLGRILFGGAGGLMGLVLSVVGACLVVWAYRKLKNQ